MRKLITILTICAGLLCLSTSSAFAHQSAHRSGSTRCAVTRTVSASRSCRSARVLVTHPTRIAG